MSYQWVYCPICKSKTRIQTRMDTIVKNFPLFCPKCKHESIVDIKENRITIVKEPDAMTQSQQ